MLWADSGARSRIRRIRRFFGFRAWRWTRAANCEERFTGSGKTLASAVSPSTDGSTYRPASPTCGGKRSTPVSWESSSCRRAWLLGMENICTDNTCPIRADRWGNFGWRRWVRWNKRTIRTRGRGGGSRRADQKMSHRKKVPRFLRRVRVRRARSIGARIRGRRRGWSRKNRL